MRRSLGPGLGLAPGGATGRLVAPPQREAFLMVSVLPPTAALGLLRDLGHVLCSGHQFPPLTGVGEVRTPGSVRGSPTIPTHCLVLPQSESHQEDIYPPTASPPASDSPGVAQWDE